MGGVGASEELRGKGSECMMSSMVVPRQVYKISSLKINEVDEQIADP